MPNVPVLFCKFFFSLLTTTDFLKCQKWAQKKQQIFFKTYCFVAAMMGTWYSVFIERGEHDRPHNCLSVREHGSCEELQQLFIEYGNAYRNADHTCYRGDDKRCDVCFYFRCTVNQRISIRQLCRQISAYSGQ